ncbi:MAG TPA: SDR family oxidoreductase [Caulobacteraceae bacterium]|nr:SDR family oxidoreductase [Caulobacteraceae bacterium]
MAKVLITGASKGIGRETALVLARAGYDVVAAMRRPAESDLEGVAARESLPITLAELDVDSDASVAKLFASDAGRPETLDVLVNNAGIYSINAVEDETLEKFQQVMDTNFFGTLRCCKAVAAAFRTRRSGTIVNVTSIAAKIVGMASGAYSASKFATEAMSEALAQELGAFGVRVAVVEPGIIATPMTIENLPKVRQGSPYPHGGRMRAFYLPTASGGPPPSIVAETIKDIIEGRSTKFRNPTGPDAEPFLGLRASQTDEQWIGLSDTLDDDVYFDRFQAISGMDLRPPKGA